MPCRRLYCYVDDVFADAARTCIIVFVFFQAEDGIRDLVRSRGLGDVYKRQQNNDTTTALRLVAYPAGLSS